MLRPKSIFDNLCGIFSIRNAIIPFPPFSYLSWVFLWLGIRLRNSDFHFRKWWHSPIVHFLFISAASHLCLYIHLFSLHQRFEAKVKTSIRRCSSFQCEVPQVMTSEKLIFRLERRLAQTECTSPFISRLQQCRMKHFTTDCLCTTFRPLPLYVATAGDFSPHNSIDHCCQ